MTINLDLKLLCLRLKKAVFVLRRPSYLLHAMKLRVFPSIEHLKVLRNLKIDVVVDVGANRGQFALLSQHLWPKAAIFMFEPNPECTNVLKKLNNRGSSNKLYEIALGRNEIIKPFHVLNSDDASSMFMHNESSYNKKYATKKEVLVQVFPLDELKELKDKLLHEENSLLKIDVQGSEMEVLEGGLELIKHIKWILIELTFQEVYENQTLATPIIQKLLDAEFDIKSIHNVVHSSRGNLIQADFLFIRKDYEKI